jgi:hypothetical protein
LHDTYGFTSARTGPGDEDDHSTVNDLVESIAIVSRSCDKDPLLIMRAYTGHALLY